MSYSHVRTTQSAFQRSALSAAISLSLLMPGLAAVINVTAPCTLVDAISSANTGAAIGDCTTGSVGSDTLVLLAGSVHSFSVSNNSTDGPNGLPSITTAITIQGNGSKIERSSAVATPDFRLFHVAASTGNLTLENVNVSGGATAPGIGGAPPFRGGAIFNLGTIQLENCTVSGNSGRYGGGIYNGPSSFATLNSCTVSGNTAATKGGGMFNKGVTVTLNTSVVSGNDAGTLGGGMYNDGTSFTLNNSTISDNSAVNRGGGLFNQGGNIVINGSTISGNSAATVVNSTGGGGMLNEGGSVTLVNSTVSGNSGRRGGAMYNDYSYVTLINSTLSGNSASKGASIGQYYGTTTLQNSIVANSQGGVDCSNDSGLLNTNNSNWFEKSFCGALAQGNVNLGPLDDNGGPTLTHALYIGSGAIDTGDPVLCAALRVNNIDQRGVSRPAGDQCDIGAFEGAIQRPGGFFVIPIKSGKSVIFSF